MKASISVTTYNRKELSEVTILSIIANTPCDEYELIVVDNCSTDGTIDMLRDMHNIGFIDKLFVNNWNKHLGVSTNQCFDLADPSAEWLINFSNDHYAMPGWFDHLMKIDEELPIDFAYCVLRPGICNETREILDLKNGAQILQPHPDVQIGGGIAIRQKTVEKYLIRFHEKWKDNVFGSIYSIIHQELLYFGLNGVEMYKPCILTQNCEFNNDKYAEYYHTFFENRKTLKRFYDAKERDGYFLDDSDVDKYYEGSGYTYSGGAEANTDLLQERITR